MSIGSNSSCLNVSLKIFREGASDYSSITQEDQGMLATPQSGPSNIVDLQSQDTSDLWGLQPEEISARSMEDDWATAGQVVKVTAKPNEPSEWISKLTNGIDTVKSLIDAVKDLHPAASIAWGIISSCVNILKQGTEREKAVLRLYEAMIMTYKEASDDRQLWRRKRLEPIYKSLFQTMNECGMLIKGYTNKNHFKRFFSLNLPQKAEEFIQGFANLCEQLKSGVAKDAFVVTLGVRVNVNTLATKLALQELRPGQELGPKVTCMPGTRVETINASISWIAECYDKVLWCSGLVGTGKSSLVGTLHNLLGFHMGNRSRLAAFIRYERTSYSNSSELIMSIAYSLGMFDQRIGDAIANALTTSRAAVKMPVSESRTQFRCLVQKPLETILELQDEGPLVVIIDGLDESDVSKELLELLADGFGPTLPFMCLIVSSRPEERISCVFKYRRQVCYFPLDTSSDEVKHNIRYFIREKFASITDQTVWGMYTKESVVTLLRRLKALLNTMIPADAMEALTILYRTTLDTIVSEIGSGDEDVRQCIRAVLGALIVRKGSMTVSMLPELVLQEEDPSAQFIIDKLGSVVQERSGSLELIHKSFDDFLQDRGRCGDRWFIDVKEHEQKLARGCVSSLTLFFKNWMPTRVQLEPVLSDIDVKKTIQDHYRHVVPSHIGDYSVNLLRWHFDAFIELGINTCLPLFDRYFLSWLEILLAFDSLFGFYEWLKVISAVNAEVTDQRLRTYVYHAFTFWERFTGLSMDPVNPAHVYTHAMSISPSANFICRDWGQSSGVNALFNKERLLALTPCSISNEPLGFTSYSVEWFYMFQGS
ncbi:hypothetical protein EV421DRAFT_1951051 [Armillaria borealis]|uniref:Nephrocystin 3-like N-terminal domain-containing protein n=1 Tax=Armillaria borealis TaxID=47425 RepID=A0AA39M5V9_9AGAR|nr:hypothetical protein EV421DRAFT_1951051 [Armillaria borealis]